MALPTISTLRPAIYNALRILFLLLILSRFYALLIAFNIVPNYPDPVIAFIAAGYQRLDAFLESTPLRTKANRDPNSILDSKTKAEQFVAELKAVNFFSLLVGNAIFGLLLRYYSPHPSVVAAAAGKGSVIPPETETETTELSKKQQKKASAAKNKSASSKESEEISLTAAAKPKSNLTPAQQKEYSSLILRRNIVIIGRLTQCAIFLFTAYRELSKNQLTTEPTFANQQTGGEVSLARPVVDLFLSLSLIAAEVNGVPWDAGLLDLVFERRGGGGRGLISSRSAGAAKKVEEPKDGEAKLKLR